MWDTSRDAPDGEWADRGDRPWRLRRMLLSSRLRPPRWRPFRAEVLRQRPAPGRPRRWRPAGPSLASVQARLPLIAALVLAGVLLAGAVLVLRVELFVPRDVTITGARRVAVAEIRRAAQVPEKTPLPLLDTSDIERRVMSLRGIASARVAADWPRGLRISVIERAPLLAVPDSGRYLLMDVEGVHLATAATRPGGLPIVSLPAAGDDGPAVRAAAHVLGTLPTRVRRDTTHLEVASTGAVTLLLRNNRRVVWGDAQRSETKAAVLAALVEHKGSVFDVSSPGMATVSR